MIFKKESSAALNAKALCLKRRMDYYVSEHNGKYKVTTKNGRGKVVQEFIYKEVIKNVELYKEENPKPTRKSRAKNKPDIDKTSQLGENDTGEDVV